MIDLHTVERSSVGVLVGCEGSTQIDKIEVVASAIDPETGGRTEIVDGRDLRLDGTREVLIDVALLVIGPEECIALVGVERPINDSSAAEVASDHATAINAKQLIKGRVSIVVEGLKLIACVRGGAQQMTKH